MNDDLLAHRADCPRPGTAEVPSPVLPGWAFTRCAGCGAARLHREELTVTDDPPTLREAIERYRAVPRELPTSRIRPPRDVVNRLLALDGKQVEMHHDEVYEDVDSIPSGVFRTTEPITLSVSLDALGWTQAEWDDPTITE